jgi:hypothetical protein
MTDADVIKVLEELSQYCFPKYITGAKAKEKRPALERPMLTQFQDRWYATASNGHLGVYVRIPEEPSKALRGTHKQLCPMDQVLPKESNLIHSGDFTTHAMTGLNKLPAKWKTHIQFNPGYDSGSEEQLYSAIVRYEDNPKRATEKDQIFAGVNPLWGIGRNLNFPVPVVAFDRNVFVPAVSAFPHAFTINMFHEKTNTALSPFVLSTESDVALVYTAPRFVVMMPMRI